MEFPEAKSGVRELEIPTFIGETTFIFYIIVNYRLLKLQ